ncbi:Uncharacterised protein [Mycobacteroides abscessus subsp. abscessus]|uniref:Uncharacterized protein n=1 Tax=Mycobacteroides abscessus TaxID=36809 RepID=A0AB33T5S6_9MYCO|nr:hypothetical protein DDJ47_21580 [Mycobacteroides abscessus]SHW30901.1 Uncharacterised protein [Mycobacteroides abscessus subsp. abscessus]SKK82211.1 Uncharacterised protein [Mycobacteroides abscessus subsp. massiliense]RIT08815.1 hypothetical protein D2E74_04660 [Mycobacteroides abscessus]RIT49329.1 hypothetical protein D2E98_01345 [Mycobacteroides abscessus]
MRIANPDDVQPGDRVTWGALGYLHEGVARVDPELWDGEISVNGGVDWHSNFKWAERDERVSMHSQAQLRDKGN